MREAADQIRDEVGRLMKDVGLLGDRVRKLQTPLQSGQRRHPADRHLGREDRKARRAHQQVEFGGGRRSARRDGSNVIAAPIPRKLEAGE